MFGIILNNKTMSTTDLLPATTYSEFPGQYLGPPDVSHQHRRGSNDSDTTDIYSASIFSRTAEKEPPPPPLPPRPSKESLDPKADRDEKTGVHPESRHVSRPDNAAEEELALTRLPSGGNLLPSAVGYVRDPERVVAYMIPLPKPSHLGVPIDPVPHVCHPPSSFHSARRLHNNDTHHEKGKDSC